MIQIAGYDIAVEIWDIISLLIPVGIIFMFHDFKRRHKTRMSRLDLIYGESKENTVPLTQEQKVQVGEELLEKLVEEKM